MRYQRVSPESVPLGNGRKSNSKTTSDDDDGSNGGYAGTCTTSRSPFKTQDPQNLSGLHHHSRTLESSPTHNHNHNHNHNLNNNGAFGSGGVSGGGGSGDGLLQWGHKKRSRISRTEIRESVQAIQKHKMRRKAPGLVVDKILSAAATTTTVVTMQPPHPLTSSLATQSLRNGISSSRNIEEQSSVTVPSSRNGGGSRSAAGKRSLVFSSPSNGSLVHMEGGGIESSSPSQHHQQLQAKNTPVVAVAEKVVLECPRIYLTLSRKEKEDDFLAMKGTKLPQRPKKRPKNIDKALQYCFPGMWLSDLTRSRYEVREKKSVKKQQQKRRGLKGMESLDSDSYQ